MSKKPFIVGIGGTTRPGSSSEQALSLALAHARKLGAETALFGGAELQMPMYDPATATWTLAAAPAAGGGEAGGGDEEKSEFDVILTAAGDKQIQVIKEVRTLTSLGLGEAKALVDGAPSTVLEGANKETAEKAKAQLEEAGATVTLK